MIVIMTYLLARPEIDLKYRLSQKNFEYNIFFLFHFKNIEINNNAF